jgi:hypothetical protein
MALLAMLHSAIAAAEPRFDETKRAVLPGEAAGIILKRYIADGKWTPNNWAISSENLDLLEVALGSALAKAGVGTTSFKAEGFYRQYMPAQWKGLHVIVVNGFYASASDLFPERGISPDLWKHELLTVFGGGCGYWNAVYVVERNEFMVPRGRGRHSAVLCNAPK